MTSTINNQYKVGVFVDVSNVYSNGGSRMRYDVLRHYAEMRGTVQRMNAYVSFDIERAKTDRDYHDGVTGFHEALRDIGFLTCIQEVKWYTDQNGNRFGKANADVQMAIDCLQQSKNLDLVILVTGDGDFVPLVQALRSNGVRVESIGFENISQALRKEVDSFTNGYLIPELIPTNRNRDVQWGEIGSTVRGTCYFHQNDKGFGFFSFLKDISTNTWITDPRHPDSPFQAAFFYDTNLPAEINPHYLPNRRTIFEFELDSNNDGLVAKNIRLPGGKPDHLAPRVLDELVIPA